MSASLRTCRYVEIVDGKIVRIFKTEMRARLYEGPGEVSFMSRKDATEAIRRGVFERSGGHCRDCGSPITWATMHMHETIERSEGGEVSLENSIALCAKCHILGEDCAHKNRSLQFKSSKSGV